MSPKNCALIGLPTEAGAGMVGCRMGPDAFRAAGLSGALEDLGHTVSDFGNLSVQQAVQHDRDAPASAAAIARWSRAIEEARRQTLDGVDLPIFLGGDHSLSIGTVPAVARTAARNGQPQFVLWLDAHPDIHTLQTTCSGNLHGTPVAYFLGFPGFEGIYPPLEHAINPDQLCMMGIRSVDPAERQFLDLHSVEVHDMRALDEHGVKRPIEAFLARVAAVGGALHVSLDVDFLEPAIAPAVGTTVPGGATVREAHLIMELLCDSGLVTSVDLVELNPFLDVRGQTATLMVDLCASLLGRRVFDRRTRQLERTQS